MLRPLTITILLFLCHHNFDSYDPILDLTTTISDLPDHASVNLSCTTLGDATVRGLLGHQQTPAFDHKHSSHQTRQQHSPLLVLGLLLDPCHLLRACTADWLPHSLMIQAWMLWPYDEYLYHFRPDESKSCVDCYVLLDPNCYQCDPWTQQNDLIMTTHYDIYNYNALARPPDAFLFPMWCWGDWDKNCTWWGFLDQTSVHLRGQQIPSDQLI